MNRYYLLSVVILCSTVLFACSTAKSIVGPDGTPHQLLTCGTVEECYEDARKTCKGPYKIVNTSSKSSGSEGSVTTKVKLLVKCGSRASAKRFFWSSAP